MGCEHLAGDYTEDSCMRRCGSLILLQFGVCRMRPSPSGSAVERRRQPPPASARWDCLSKSRSPSSLPPSLIFCQVVPTTIEVTEAPNGSCSVLKIKTADRPGLLVDIVRVLKDVNLNVVSAEVDTVGTEAEDEFFVTYRVRDVKYSGSCMQLG